MPMQITVFSAQLNDEDGIGDLEEGVMNIANNQLYSDVEISWLQSSASGINEHERSVIVTTLTAVVHYQRK